MYNTPKRSCIMKLFNKKDKRSSQELSDYCNERIVLKDFPRNPLLQEGKPRLHYKLNISRLR